MKRGSEASGRRRVIERRAGVMRGAGQLEGTRRVGFWQTWHANGALASEGVYRDGLLDGTWKSWSPAGTKRGELTYRLGLLHGLWRTWHESGSRESEGTWEAGAREGEWRTWDESGRLSSRGRWHQGRREGGWLCDWGNGPIRTEWFRGSLTDRRGAPPRQPPGQREHYYPVVPGQQGFETPFDTPGHASGLCFGFVPGLSRLTCLFRPPAPISPMSGGGLFLAIGERRQSLWLLEKRFAVGPEASPPGRVRARAYPAMRFLVFRDPLAADPVPPEAVSTFGEGVRTARAATRGDGVRRVVGALIGDYPLDS